MRANTIQVVQSSASIDAAVPRVHRSASQISAPKYRAEDHVASILKKSKAWALLDHDTTAMSFTRQTHRVDALP